MRVSPRHENHAMNIWVLFVTLSAGDDRAFALYLSLKLF